MSLRRNPENPKANADRAPSVSPHPVRGHLLGVVVAVGAVLATTALYPAAFGTDIHPLGPDMFGYIWETRFVGAGPLAEVGTRPGMPVLGSVLSGFHAVPAADAPLVLGLVLAVTLGLAISVAVRLAFRLPPWSSGVVTFLVALWGGVIYLSKGYLANELSLVGFVVATLLVALPGEHGLARVLGGLAAGAAAGLAHPGLLPFYAAVDCLWLFLSLPGILGRRDDRAWWDEASVRAMGVLAGASALTTLVVFGFMGLSISEVTNLTAGVREFSDKLTQVAGSIGLWITAVPLLAGVGVIAAWRLRGPSSQDPRARGPGLGALLDRRRPGDPRPPEPARTSSAAGHPSAPGRRRDRDAWIAWALNRAGRRPSEPEAAPRPAIVTLSAVAAAGLVAAGCALMASPGLARITDAGEVPARGDTARLVASYVATIEPTTPVVVFSRPVTDMGALSWRGRQNQVRAYVPTPPTSRPRSWPWGCSMAPTVRRPSGYMTWGSRMRSCTGPSRAGLAAGPALRGGAIVVVPQAYSDPSAWAISSRSDPSRVVAPGLAVLRGPATVPNVPVAPAAVPSAEATLRALACLVVLGALGGGFAVAGGRALDGALLDAAALAPAVGVVLVVLGGVAVAVSGGDPKGRVGSRGRRRPGAGRVRPRWRSRWRAENGA